MRMISLTLAALLTSTTLATAQSRPDDVLDVVAPFEILGPDPSTSGSVFQSMDIAETLVDADLAGQLRPGLAESWSVSDDGLTWRFAVRPGVVFHDGTPLTAEAAVQALEVARSKPGLLVEAPIEAITAEGNEVVIRLTEPLVALPAFLAEYRSQILAPAAYAEDGTVTEMIGTGPYQVTELAPPLRLTATLFEDYWGTPATIGDVTYQSVGRAETRALMAESGDADLVFNLDPASTQRLTQGGAVEVLSVSIPRSLLLKINAAHPHLTEPEARRALSLAIDREGLARAVLRYPAAAGQLFPPSVPDWHNDTVAPLPYDPEEAKRVLAELGWTPGTDGILERDGQRFALTLTTYPDRPELPLVAAVLEQLFRQIGVEVTINSTNSSAIPAGHQDGTLELSLLARNFALVPDPIGTILQDYAPNGDWGAMGWDNPEFASLVTGLARGEGGAEDRQRAIEILQTDLPVIPIAWYQQTMAVTPALEGAQIDPYERSFGLPALTWVE